VRFTFNAAPAVRLENAVPNVDIGWSTFAAARTTVASPHAVYAIENTAGTWGVGSQLVENVIHTATCDEGERLSITAHSEEPAYDENLAVLHTIYTCGEDNALGDPCIFGSMSRVTGFCECEFGCGGGEICQGRAEAADAEVYVCYDSGDLAYVPLRLHTRDAVALLRHPGIVGIEGTESGRRRHRLRDTCDDSGALAPLPRDVCTEFAPDEGEFMCNCGPAAHTNHTVPPAAAMAVVSEAMAIVIHGRDADVARHKQEAAAARSLVWVASSYGPMMAAVFVVYTFAQKIATFMPPPPSPHEAE